MPERRGPLTGGGTLRGSLATVPAWVWWTLISLLVAPLYLRYFAWALAGSINFWAPMR